jgi:multiple sugar transport system substrate-binding protein
MKKNVLFKAFSLLVILSFALAACGAPATVATEAPAAEESAATEAPAVEAPAATEAPMMEEVAIRWRTRPDNQEEIDV